MVVKILFTFLNNNVRFLCSDFGTFSVMLISFILIGSHVINEKVCGRNWNLRGAGSKAPSEMGSWHLKYWNNSHEFFEDGILDSMM